MGKDYKSIINHLLVNTFNQISNVEEMSVRIRTGDKLTMNEMHILEAMDYDKNYTMTELANILSIATSTLSTIIDKLVKKGFVERGKSEEDRRIVRVSLTKRGRLMVKVHKRFHKQMVEEALKGIDGIDEGVMPIILKISDQLTQYFIEERKRLERLQKESEEK